MVTIIITITITMAFCLLGVASSQGGLPDNFTIDGYLNLEGTAELNSNGLVRLTNDTEQQSSHIFYNTPFQFKNSTNASAVSFSTAFVFVIVPQYPTLGGHGMTFVISPTKDLKRAFPSYYLGLFNTTNIGKSANHIVAIEMDTIMDFDFQDINDNHVGVDINGLVSIEAKPAGYFNRYGKFEDLKLISGEPMQVWVEYDGLLKQLNVTISPIDVAKPELPLLSVRIDLSPILLDFMYVGFTSSTGSVRASHYLLGWSFKMNGVADQINLSRLPKLPWIQQENNEQAKKVLIIVLPLVAFLILLVLIVGTVFISRVKKFKEVLEDWEVMYGPHRFRYKDLFVATNGFKDKEILGKGGFGKVYRGFLQKSKIQIAVKRVSHDSSQGMREFVAEIATIGRLRHPNLVRLLGYSRRKQELLLVYDFMPNGSLDKFLYGQPKEIILNWTQRFKILKDIASGLLYLHQQWMQVVIHRDIKPSNVLIDNEFNAKLGDFGLAKLCDHGLDPQTSHLAGTLGYIAPEFARTGKASKNTDMFAFGVFMLELVCGRRPVEPRALPKQVILIDFVSECLEGGNILEPVDQNLGSEYVMGDAELVLKLGLLCSHDVAEARPNITDVVKYLEGEAQVPDNLLEVIKCRDYLGAVNAQEDKLPSSPPGLTISEHFQSMGR